MHQARARSAAGKREAMRHQGVHLDAGDGIFAFRSLLDDADGVHHGLGLELGEHRFDAVRRAHIHPGKRLAAWNSPSRNMRKGTGAVLRARRGCGETA